MHVIDADGHVDEDAAWIIGNLPENVRELAPKLVNAEGGFVEYLIEGRPWKPKFAFPFGFQTHTKAAGEKKEAGRDPRARLEVLDSEGITAAVLLPSLAMMFHLYQDPQTGAALCRSYNDWLALYCSADPSRLAGVAVLPQQDPSNAVEELERCVTQHGFVAGVIRPNRIAGRTIDNPDWEPLWAAASSLDAPIIVHEAYVHGIDTIAEDRAANYAAAHVMAHPFEQMASMTATAVAGILNRHPKLRIGFFEAGCTWAPYLQQRIEEHFEHMPSEFGGDPTGLLNKRSWVTFEVEEWGVQLAAELGWKDNIVFASDFPHFDAQFPGAVKMILERGFGADLERKLLFDNALGFYGERLEKRIAPALKMT
jgi:uncharacterized protein